MQSPLYPDQHNKVFADIILPLNLPQALTYGVPAEMQDMLQVGMRVEVSLGRNKYYSGLVEKIHNHQPEAYTVKPIRHIIDEAPIVNAIQLKFWQWIAHYYMATPGEVMQGALPAHLKLAGETRLRWDPQDIDVVYEWSDETYPAAETLQARKELSLTELRNLVGARHLTKVINELLEQEVVYINDNLETNYRPKKEKVITLHKDYQSQEALAKLFNEFEKKAPRQLELLMGYIQLSMHQDFVKQQDVLELSKATTAQVKALVDKGIFIIEEKITDRLIFSGQDEAREIEFTPAQAKAYEELEKGLQEKDVLLLQGVTGSGKTLLYIHKIREYLAAGKQAVFLLPEIALTTQLVKRLYAYFGEEMGVYHSGLAIMSV
jgi:primosomal protein N' (replication factor Y)